MKRTRKYVAVEGFTVTPKGNIEESTKILDGSYRSKDAAANAVRREFKDFIPRVITFHRQVCTMTDETFYNNCDFGEDVVYDVPDSSEVNEDSDVESDK